MVITDTQFAQCFPTLKEGSEWCALLNMLLPKYNITTVTQVAMFLAQTGHESADFKVVSENLFYSAERLLVVFPKYFNTSNVATYSRNPEKIANLVYANRMGNGSVESGDGYKYCGRGLIQLTGKTNYTACSLFLYNDLRLVTTPELVAQVKSTCILSAIWFWTANKLETLDDITVITKKINGGVNSLDDRISRYNKVIKALTQ